ncbi:uncharacterized protein LOC143344982 [Colletes latitarsis]|uniref:uncharacterized protein LOC143344982 n=1 Tax=Colletes latitarsis TaxID=2605962 RepID=UPI004035FAA7
MELGEGEAQICRLCGQCERIYIDVFGEEGTKRFLGLKIHTKINILIDERDPLPKAICVQCLGKLEFVCDFQEECLRTQQALRDRYNLPSLTETADVKTEETTPSTSTNNNNNDMDKNLNSPSEENARETEPRISRTTKSQRNLRSQQQAKNNEEIGKEQIIMQSMNDENGESMESPETTPTRWLRSRQNTETTSTNEKATDPPIANRLRSHNSTAMEVTVSSRNNSIENMEKQTGKQQDPHTIQIPTSALNKLLTSVSNSPNIEVSVKESRNQSNDVEDISFTVELCKKESDDVATVRAQVFPDQGSCLVDKAIVDLLQNQSCVEVNSIINTIISTSLKNGNSAKSRDSADFEQKWQISQNPEELFKIDGEEIRVDDNVEHIVTDNQNGYSCKLCRKFYERKDKCMVHVKTHLGIKQYTCILCNAKFVCKSDVIKHIRCSHTNPRPIQCPKCPKRFKSKFYLMEHDNVHKGVRPYSCTDCGQSYHHKVSLQIHMKSHLPPQNLACEYCSKIFPYRTRLLCHIGSVHLKNRRNFKCRFCYNLYSSLSVLNEHIKTRHATTYTCEVCSKTFKVASKYKAHVLQHSNPKPFVCNICNNRYASKTFLSEHLLKHEGLRKYICQKCGARFAQASHLAAHRHVHGEKKHACPECGRKFNRRDNMKVHRKRHFKEKKTVISKQKNASGADVTSTVSNEKLERKEFYIIIKENDGLPHIVCIRCIGTLEFLCDFYETCHLTQMELSGASKNKLEETYQQESDTESDKENTFPSMYDAKRKAKVLLPGGSKSTKHGLAVNNESYYSNETKDGSNSLYRIDNNDCSNKVQSVMRMAVQKCTKVLALDEKENVSKETIIRNRRSESLNSTIRSSQNASNSIHSEQPLRRKRGRKSKIEKMKEASVYLSLKRKLEEHVQDEKNKDNPYKRHYLHTIWINNKSNLANNSVILSKPQVERAAKEEVVVDASSNEFHDEDSKNVTIPDDNTIEAETNVKDSEIIEDPLKMNEDNSMKSKAISVIVKQEKGETESAFPQQTKEIDQLVWISNDVSIQEQENLIDSPLKEEIKQITNKKSNFTAQYDVAEHSDVLTITDHKDLKSEIFEEQNRVTVIKSFQTSGSSITKKMQEVKTEVYVTTNATSQSIKDDSESDDADLSFMQLLSPDSKFNRNKSKDRSFAKITELISDEQKEAIETYYTVDMSIVNPAEVQKNLTIIDKKNIRCNICGTFYLRMDKCQVHIWGHLKMKPYQCKACDFSTVTVTNVRCHIRKSHLKIKPFECHLCERKYVTAVLLEEHINTHTGARPFKCKLCDFTSASRQMLSYHSATHKPQKDINCKICDKEFYSRGRLRAHMIIHNKDKFVVCKLCSAYLSSQEALKTHNKNVHSQDYVCNVCGKHVQSRKALHNHQNVHAAAKYKCSLCPNMYKSSQILKEHLLKHEGIRKYKCPVCEKSFGQQSHVAAHMAVHSKIRFHCPACDKPFNRHDNMKMHTKRCQLFLANPDLKNRIFKRERNISFKKATELNEDSISGDTSNSVTRVEDQNIEPLMKTVDKKEELEMNVCKIGLNISCIKSVNETWRCDDVYKEAGEITGSTEINLIQITGVNDNFIPENENLIVRETILGPESF